MRRVLPRLKPQRDPAAKEAGGRLRSLCDAHIGIAARGRDKFRSPARISLVLALARVRGDGRGKLIARAMRRRRYGRLAHWHCAGGE
jgi:hypothetical protein